MLMKKLIWIGSSLEDLKKLPSEVQQNFGFSLYSVQAQMPPASPSKALKGFKLPIIELIESHDKETYRAVYTTKIGQEIFVLHVFQKKSKSGISLPKRDKEIIEKRLLEAQALSKEVKSHGKKVH